MKESLKWLLSKFPYFLSRQPESNFYKTEKVYDEFLLKDLYQSLFNTYKSNHLDKPILVWREQTEANEYQIHFEVDIENIKEIIILKNDSVIKSLNYSADESINNFSFTYEGVSEETIPLDAFSITVTTYDEYILQKGIPENDTIENNEFDHDIGLDKIGKILDTPRRTYKKVNESDYKKTFPTFCNEATEQDYYYLQRLTLIAFSYQILSLPELEVLKLLSLESSIRNREDILCKMFDTNKHVLTYADDSPVLDDNGNTIYDESWKPLKTTVDGVLRQIEHKDEQCIITKDKQYYLFTSADNLNPIFSTKYVNFSFKILNELGKEAEENYYIVPYLNGIAIENEIITNNTWKILVEDLAKVDVPTLRFKLFFSKAEMMEELETYDNTFIIKDDSIVSDEFKISIRGCSDADFYVDAVDGNDNYNGSQTQPFRTIQKALDSVEGNKNLIYLKDGTHETSKTLQVKQSCTILSCTQTSKPIIKSAINKAFAIPQGKTLTLVNLKINYNCRDFIIKNTTISNDNGSNIQDYINLEGIEKKPSPNITITSPNTSNTTTEISASGKVTLTDGTAIPNKVINIEVDGNNYSTATDTNGEYTTSIGYLTYGQHEIKVIAIEDDDYCCARASKQINIEKTTPTLTLTWDNETDNLQVPYGTINSFTASINKEATGIIKLYKKNTVIAEGEIDNGMVNFQVEENALKVQVYRAVYSGDDKYSEVSSSSVGLKVVNRDINMNVLCEPSTIEGGDAVTLNIQFDQEATGTAEITVFDEAMNLIYATTQTINGKNNYTVFTSEQVSNDTTYTILVTYTSTNYYNSKTASTNLIVNKTASTFLKLSLASDKTSAIVGNNFTLTGTVKDGYDEKINNASIKLMEGTTILDTKTSNSNGEVTFSYNGSEVGLHNLYLQYDATTSYTKSTSNILSLNVLKHTTNLVLTPSKTSIVYNEAITATAKLTDEENNSLDNQSITFLIDNALTIQEKTNTNGVATLQSHKWLSTGNKKIKATYTGDDTNESSTTEKTITVNKATPTISLVTSKTTINAGELITLSATVPSDATGKVTFLAKREANGITLGEATITDSNATLSTKSLPSGNITIVATYNGDNNYNTNEATASVTVKEKITTTLTMEDLTAIEIGNGTSISAVLKDINGNKLSDKKVSFTTSPSLNNTLTGTTNSSGRAIVNLTPTSATTYTITATFAGDDEYTSSTVSKTLTVNKKATTLTIQSNKTSIEKGGSLLLQANVSPSDATGTVTYKIGTTTIKTQEAGASFVYTSTQSSNFIISANYSGDDEYKASTATKSITVLIDTNLSLSVSNASPNVDDSVVLTAVLKDTNGNVVKDANVKFYNGSTLITTGTTDTTGTTKTTYKTTTSDVGSLTFKAVFDTTSQYKTSNATKTITVNKIATTIALSANTSVKTGKSNTITATIKDANGNNVSMNTTWYKGSTQIATNVSSYTESSTPVGDTIYKVVTSETGKYKASEATITVTGTKLDTKLTCVNTGTFYQGHKLRVKLTDENNVALTSKAITIKWNGVSYDRTTNSEGIAELTINSASGSLYYWDATFNAEDIYNRSYIGDNTYVNGPISVTKTGTILTQGCNGSYCKDWSDLTASNLSGNEPNNYATCSNIASSAGTYKTPKYVDVRGFGFNIPTNATIKYIRHYWVGRLTSTTANPQFDVKFFNYINWNGSDLTSEIASSTILKSGSTNWQTLQVDVSPGNLTPEMINSSNFNGRAEYGANQVTNSGTIHWTYYHVEVFYIPAQS